VYVESSPAVGVPEAATCRTEANKETNPPQRQDEESDASKIQDFNAPGSEFSINVKKAERESSAGLALDPKDSCSAVVISVWPGPVQAWNMANRDREVRPNDRIISVNGARGDVQLILDRLREDQDLEIVLRRPTEFRVLVAAKRSLGITVRYAPHGTSLLVDRVNQHGLVKVWNMAYPDHEVQVHDRIVEVNGIRGPPDLLLRELNSAGALELVIFR